MEAWVFPESDEYKPLSAVRSADEALSALSSRHFHDPVIHQLRRRSISRPNDWARSIDLRGFRANEVSVKVEDNRLKVLARHEDGEDSTEARRSLELPEHIQANQLCVCMTQGGILLVRAPFKEEAIAASTASIVRNPGSSSVWDEVRHLLAHTLEGHVVDSPQGCVYRVEVPVREFRPDEIRIHAKDDTITIEAEHVDESSGHKVRRKLERSFQAPAGTDIASFTSRLTHDGRMCIEAPMSSTAAGHSQNQVQLDLQ